MCLFIFLWFINSFDYEAGSIFFFREFDFFLIICEYTLEFIFSWILDDVDVRVVVSLVLRIEFEKKILINFEFRHTWDFRNLCCVFISLVYRSVPLFLLQSTQNVVIMEIKNFVLTSTLDFITYYMMMRCLRGHRRRFII